MPCWHAMPTLGHARYTQDSHVRKRLRAGELSRGVGLRGFESQATVKRTNTPLSGRNSHSPHQQSDLEAPLSELAAFGFWMQKQGYRQSTIKGCIKSLKPIARQTNLLDPEIVKGYLAKATVSENTKDKLTQDMTRFYKYKGISWTAPRYRRVEKLPFVPLESEVEQLVSGMGKKTACFLQLLNETIVDVGLRPYKWLLIRKDKRRIDHTWIRLRQLLILQ